MGRNLSAQIITLSNNKVKPTCVRRSVAQCGEWPGRSKKWWWFNESFLLVTSTYPLKVMSTGIFKEIFGSFRYKISTFFAGFFTYNLDTFAYVMKKFVYKFVYKIYKFCMFVLLVHFSLYCFTLTQPFTTWKSPDLYHISVTWPRDVITTSKNGTNCTTEPPSSFRSLLSALVVWM